MNYRIVFLPEALSDADEIRRYLSKYYTTTVKNFFATLKKRTNSLRSNPFSAQTYLERPAYRRLVVDEYIVFYKKELLSRTP